MGIFRIPATHGRFFRQIASNLSLQSVKEQSPALVKDPPPPAANTTTTTTPTKAHTDIQGATPPQSPCDVQRSVNTPAPLPSDPPSATGPGNQKEKSEEKELNQVYNLLQNVQIAAKEPTSSAEKGLGGKWSLSLLFELVVVVVVVSVSRCLLCDEVGADMKLMPCGHVALCHVCTGSVKVKRCIDTQCRVSHHVAIWPRHYLLFYLGISEGVEGCVCVVS